MSKRAAAFATLLVLLAPPAAAQDLQSEEDALRWCHERGEMFSCTQIAMRYLTGDVPTEDPVGSAVPLLQKACESDYANACHNLAVAYEQDMVEGRTVVDAAETYARACALGEGESCSCASALLLVGDKKLGMEPDEERALALNQAGCELRDGWSCYFLAAQHFKGWGTPRDYAAAEQAAAAGCQAHLSQACKLRKKAGKKAAKERD